MRRQYHSQKTDRGTLIWDVHRLVQLSRAFPIIEMPINSISELNQRFWFDKSDQTPSCKEIAVHAKLIEETDLKHPIILSEDGRVMDGMHRVCKAWMAGHKTIKAVRFETNPEPDHIDVPMDDLPYDEPW